MVGICLILKRNCQLFSNVVVPVYIVTEQRAGPLGATDTGVQGKWGYYKMENRQLVLENLDSPMVYRQEALQSKNHVTTSKGSGVMGKTDRSRTR